MSVINILRFAREQRASEVLLSNDQTPMARYRGEFRRLATQALSYEGLVSGILPLLSAEQHQELESITPDSPFRCWLVKVDGYRFRLTWQQQNQYAAASIRLILPWVCKNSADLDTLLLQYIGKPGLIIVSGLAGSGRSSTVTRLLEEVNYSDSKHLYTVSPVIEWQHVSRQSVVNQFAWGVDNRKSMSFLDQAQYSQPDILYVDEISNFQVLFSVLSQVLLGRLVIITVRASTIQEGLRYLLCLSARDDCLVKHVLANHLSLLVHQAIEYNSSEASLHYQYCEITDDERRQIQNGLVENLGNIHNKTETNHIL